MKWGQFQFSSDTEMITEGMSALLDGAQARKFVTGAHLGILRASKSGVELVRPDGTSERLTAAKARAMEFGIEDRKVGAVEGASASGTASEGRSALDIINAYPPHLQPTIAKYVAPDLYAQWERHQAQAMEAQKQARVAQLSRLGRVVSGKEKPASAEAGKLSTTHGKFAATATATTAQEARIAKLQSIGKAASGGRR